MESDAIQIEIIENSEPDGRQESVLETVPETPAVPEVPLAEPNVPPPKYDYDFKRYVWVNSTRRRARNREKYESRRNGLSDFDFSEVEEDEKKPKVGASWPGELYKNLDHKTVTYDGPPEKKEPHPEKPVVRKKLEPSKEIPQESPVIVELPQEEPEPEVETPEEPPPKPKKTKKTTKKTEEDIFQLEPFRLSERYPDEFLPMSDTIDESDSFFKVGSTRVNLDDI